MLMAYNNPKEFLSYTVKIVYHVASQIYWYFPSYCTAYKTVVFVLSLLLAYTLYLADFQMKEFGLCRLQLSDY